MLILNIFILSSVANNIKHLNTSYVDIKRSCIYKNMNNSYHLNTSYVDIKHL